MPEPGLWEAEEGEDVRDDMFNARRISLGVEGCPDRIGKNCVWLEVRWREALRLDEWPSDAGVSGR
jgi:hypothetical protein